MKCYSMVSSTSSMSAKNCSVKLRILILVVNTANFINERATTTIGINHALIGPTAIFTTYIFITSFVCAAIRYHYASLFIQIYALVACCSAQIWLSFIVFKGLKTSPMVKQNASLVLDGVLPMICALLLLVDLTEVLFSNRTETPIPSPSTSDSRLSPTANN